MIYPLVTIAALGFYIIHRNNQTYRLRMKITDICYEYTIRQIRNGIYDDDAMEWCDDQLPSYNKMVLSFHKQLRVEDWLTTEQLNKLNPNF